jgi:hypothetical protein
MDSKEYSGAPFEVIYTPPVRGKYGRPSSLSIKAAAQTPTALTFSAETWFDRMCKRIGIAREHQTGDEDFDQATYIRGPSFGYAEKYLEDAQKRAAMVGLRRLGFSEIRLNGTDAEVIWPGFDPKKLHQEILAERAAEHLSALSQKLPADVPDQQAMESDLHGTWLALLWFSVVLYGLIGVFTIFFPPIRPIELLKPTIGFLIVAIAVFGWISAFLIRGRSNSHNRWAILMGIGVFLIGFGSAGAVAAVNAVGDDGPLGQRTAPIASKRHSTGRGGTKSHFVSVPAWDEKRDTIEFRVSSTEFELIVPGKAKLQIVTGAGRLGIEWLHSKKVLP